MGKALRIDIQHPRAIALGKILNRGERSFNELHIRDRMILYDCNLHLEGLVTTEELLEFKLELAQKRDAPLRERLKHHAKLQAHNVRQNTELLD